MSTDDSEREKRNEQYLCPECDRAFDSKRARGVHIAQAHGSPEVECEACGNHFEVRPSRVDEKRFCSRECEREATKEVVTCEWCGSDYKVKRSRLDRTRFCSRECRVAGVADGRKRRVVKECEGCGAEFEAPKYRAEKARWCSRNCPGRSVSKECEWCGAEYEVNAAQADGSRFCSRGCLASHQSEYRSGEDSWNWEGGVMPYGEGWNEPKKEAVRERDGRVCQYCGRDEDEHIDEFGTKHVVHHIVPARSVEDPEQRNAMDNLVTLCRGDCHRAWEGIPLKPDYRGDNDHDNHE